MIESEILHVSWQRQGTFLILTLSCGHYARVTRKLGHTPTTGEYWFCEDCDAELPRLNS